MRSLRAQLAALALLACLALTGIASAALYPSVAFPTFSGSINSETTIATAAAGTHLTIHSAVATIVSSGTGSVVTFRDGTAGTVIGYAYLSPDVTTLIGQDVWGPVGYKTSASSGIITATAAGSNSNLAIVIRCDQQ
jgi:hypothetical protein